MTLPAVPQFYHHNVFKKQSCAVPARLTCTLLPPAKQSYPLATAVRRCLADIDRPPLGGPIGMLIQHRSFDQW